MVMLNRKKIISFFEEIKDTAAFVKGMKKQKHEAKKLECLIMAVAAVVVVIASRSFMKVKGYFEIDF